MKYLACLAIVALCTLCGGSVASSGAGDLHLAIDNRGRADAAQVRSILAPQLDSIHRILRSLGGIEGSSKLDLNLTLYPDRESYLQYATTVTGRDMNNSGGFYRKSNNEAVTYMHSDTDKTLELAKHESTHVMVAGMLGATPKWLNEGLADYFSSLCITDSGEEVSEKSQWLALARRTMSHGYTGKLESLLSLDAKGWNTPDKNKHYAVSWALVYFLMSSKEGKASVGALLRQSAKSGGKGVDSVVSLESSYPGGWMQLQQDFHFWVEAEDGKTSHRYELH